MVTSALRKLLWGFGGPLEKFDGDKSRMLLLEKKLERGPSVSDFKLSY